MSGEVWASRSGEAWVPIGYTTDGNPVQLDLTQPEIGGAPGRWQSNVRDAMLRQARDMNFQIVMAWLNDETRALFEGCRA